MTAEPWPAEWASGMRTIRTRPAFDPRNRGIDELELAAQHCANVVGAGGDLVVGLLSFSMTTATAKRITADQDAFYKLVREYVANDAIATASHPLEIEPAMALASEPSDDWDTEETPGSWRHGP